MVLSEKSSGDQLTASDINTLDDQIDENTDISPPVGSIVPWAKTFDSHDSGTTDATTANKLVESGQNFQTTVSVGDVVHNTTDDTFAYVSAVDSDTTLSIDSDIMVSGETYVIYATTALPSDGNWVECNGQVLSDANSIFDGATIPDLNASSGTARFLRGAISSGATGGAETHDHTFSGSPPTDITEGSGSARALDVASSLPSYYSVVWIMRVK